MYIYMCVCVCVCERERERESVHDQMRLNYPKKIYEFYIYLNRRDIKFSYGEIIRFLS